MTGSIRGVTVRNGNENGTRLASGTWRLAGVNVADNAGDGFMHTTLSNAGILDADIQDCFVVRNGGSRATFDTTSTAEIRLNFIGGK